MKFVFDHEPSQEELSTALKTIPAGPLSNKTLDYYIDHVVCIKQNKKDRVQGKDVWRSEWRPYLTVDGRIRIFNDVHTEQNKTYKEIITEARLGDGRLSKYLIIGMTIDSEIFDSRSDYAVADLDAQGADASNPYENATTSVRGRVIAAFGFGIIPSQGIASANEVVNALARQATTVTAETEQQELSKSRQPQDDDKPQKQNANRKAAENNLKVALSKWDGTQDELIALHRAQYAMNNAGNELPEDIFDWPPVEILKLQRTATENNQKNRG